MVVAAGRARGGHVQGVALDTRVECVAPVAREIKRVVVLLPVDDPRRAAAPDDEYVPIGSVVVYPKYRLRR
jgi:hypothetical protein